MAILTSPAAAAIVNTSSALIKRDVYIDNLEKGNDILRDVEFGGLLKIVDNIIIGEFFDKDNWEKEAELTYTEFGVGVQSFKVKPNILPSVAVSEIFDRSKINKWRFDCQMYANIIHLYAILKSIGDKRFNKYFSDKKNGEKKKVCLIHFNIYDATSGKAYNMPLVEYTILAVRPQFESDYNIYGLAQQRKIKSVTEEEILSIGGYLDDVPVGSLVIFKNFDPNCPENFPFKNENAIKWKNATNPNNPNEDIRRFIAHGFSPNNIFNMETIKELLGDRLITNILYERTDEELALSGIDRASYTFNATQRINYINDNIAIFMITRINLRYVEDR